MDYYIDGKGQFTGQYICVDLEDFCFKNLHIRVGPKHFNLHYHRIEVVRDPTGADEPIFPLLHRYQQMNETLDGLEAHDATYITDDYETTIEDWYGKCPDRT